MGKIEITARYHETDQMGIIHHSVYLNWFEVGRTRCIRDFGVSYAEIEQRGILLPVIGADLSYKIPAKYEDVVDVTTRVSSYNGIRLDFNYQVHRQTDDRLLVDGYTHHCWTDKEMKPVSLKKHWPELHETIKSMAEAQ